MTFDDFHKSLSDKQPPENMSEKLLSLWYDANNDWEKAHQVIQEFDDKDAALIHAYLHRKEGDIGNADYWYRNAGKKRPDLTLEQEWEQLVRLHTTGN